MCANRRMRDVYADPFVWRKIAERKFGRHVDRVPAEVGAADWKRYCTRRMSFVSREVSPLALIQEQFTDPFSHLMACALCSRTSGSELIHRTICDTIRSFPNPSAVLDADDGDICARILPLGLSETRLRTLRSLAEGFLLTDFEDPSEFWGIGEFASQSYHLMCRNELHLPAVGDCNLQRWQKYQLRLLRKERGEGEDEGEQGQAPRKRAAPKKRAGAVSRKGATGRGGAGVAKVKGALGSTRSGKSFRGEAAGRAERPRRVRT